MKKILSLLLVFTLALTLFAGCTTASVSESTDTSNETVSASQEGESASEEAQVVTLKIAHNMDFVTIPDAVIAAGERLNEKYAEEGKNIVVEFETDYQRIDWNDYMQNVMFAERNGEGPDIFSTNEDINTLLEAGMAMDVSELVTDDFIPAALTSCTIDGKLYAIPFDLPTRTIYYNKDALRGLEWTQEEIDALPQQMASGEFSFEDFIALATEVRDAGLAEWGLAHRPGSGKDFLDVLKVLGGEYYDENGQLLIDEQGVKTFFQFMYDQANVSKITATDLSQQGWDTINSSVGSGETFAYYGPVFSTTYVASSVDMTVEELVESIGFAPFPVSENNDEPFVVVDPQKMAINANTEHPEICMDLMKELFLGSSQEALATHSDTILSLSSISAVNDMEPITSNPLLSSIVYMQDLAVAPPVIEGLATYNAELHKQIVLLELGQVDVETAYNDFVTQVELNIGEENLSYK